MAATVGVVDDAAKAAKAKKSEPEAEPQEKHTAEPILDLTSAPERPYIRFDGKPYDLHILDDFGIEEQQVLTREGGEFDQLWHMDPEQMTRADKERLKVLLDRMFERILDAPKTIKAKFNDGARSSVVMAFTLAPLAAAARREQELETARAEKESSSTTEN